mmetsp:Transcript_30082/g.56832  ORF Transcript_30082/g.56832 Transcript_30082/m.56832 type:complete len:754 (-) Transcript_30082:508-2769(-)
MGRTSDKLWQNAVKWIESNGGYVHPKLEYDETHRQVYLGKQVCEREDDNATTVTLSKPPPPTTTAAAVGEVSSIDVDAGMTLLKIPDACLVTLHSAEDDTAFGKSLFGVVHSLLPSDRINIEEMHTDDDIKKKGGSSNISSSTNSDDELSGLYHDAQDVILAVFLAYLTHRLDHSHPEHSSANNHIAGNDTTAPWLFYQPYLATLPSSSAPPPSSTDKSTTSSTTPAKKDNDDFCCHLPRQWSASILKRRLEGTSLYNRILKEQRGIRREYELVKEAWMNKHNNECNAHNTNNDGINNKNGIKNPIFPPFQYYDNMMAALTSRGFVGLGHDGVDALIPMLDLLNHVRGGGEGAYPVVETSDSDGNGIGQIIKENIYSNNLTERTRQHDSNHGINETTSKSRGGPDVRYERYEEPVVHASRASDEPPSSKRPRTTDYGSNNKREHDVGGGGGVRVTTSRPLSFGVALHMTYGAKGNAALLGRYGFCIPNNVEPDGSCNDVLEIEIKTKEQPVKLQRGPKSYCYGPFVKALELCRNSADENSNENGASTMDEDCCEVQEDKGDDTMDGGLEAFLDSCDNEFEEDGMADDDDECDENDDDYFYNPSTNPNTARANNSHQTSLMNDIRAVDVLKGVLQNAKAGCANNLLCTLESTQNQGDNNEDTPDEDRFCAILVRSEIQIIDFYLAAADTLRHRLAEHWGRLQPQTAPLPESQHVAMDTAMKEYAFDNDNVVWEQINALVDAFLSIRHPQIKMKE